MQSIITSISLWIIPSLISLILVFAIWNRVAVYETFIDGAKDGFSTALQIMPHLVGMMVAITVFRESGALKLVTDTIQPIFDLLHFPKEVFPLAIMKPLSGTGTLALTTDIIAKYGPDSHLGRLASTMQGSADTTLFIITVYFGAVGIKKVGYSIKVGLFADFVGIVASIIIVSFYFN